MLFFLTSVWALPPLMQVLDLLPLKVRVPVQEQELVPVRESAQILKREPELDQVQALKRESKLVRVRWQVQVQGVPAVLGVFFQTDFLRLFFLSSVLSLLISCSSGCLFLLHT